MKLKKKIQQNKIHFFIYTTLEKGDLCYMNSNMDILGLKGIVIEKCEQLSTNSRSRMWKVNKRWQQHRTSLKKDVVEIRYIQTMKFNIEVISKK